MRENDSTRRAYMRDAMRRWRAKHHASTQSQLNEARAAKAEAAASAEFEPTPGENWRQVADLPYDVSDMGRVRSHRRVVVNSNGAHRVIGGIVLRPWTMGTGYLAVNVTKTRLVHRLVLEAFVGPCGEGQQCRHLNGDRQDARLSNLAWGTQSENEADKLAHGTHTRGSRHGGAKLTDDDVRAIRAMRHGGALLKDIASTFGISRSAASLIASGVRWAHVE